MTSRLHDISELLEAVAGALVELEDERVAALTDEERMYVSRVKLKASIENLRSCLDYAAHEIAENVLRPSTKKSKEIYFPYGSDEARFRDALRNRLPGLQGILLTAVEEMQPHKCGSNWLVDLCKHTNANKHQELEKQDRQNSPDVTTRLGNLVRTSGGSGGITIGKLVVNGRVVNPQGALVVSNSRSVRDISTDVQNLIPVTRTFGHVRYVFKGSDVDVIELVKTAHREVSKFLKVLVSVLKASDCIAPTRP